MHVICVVGDCVYAVYICSRVHLSPLLSPIKPAFLLVLHEKRLPDFFQIFKMIFSGYTSALKYLLGLKSENLSITKRKKLEMFLRNLQK